MLLYFHLVIETCIKLAIRIDTGDMAVSDELIC